MQIRKIGGYQVSPLGLGAMPLSIEDRPDRDTAISVIHRALDLGINHIDTAFAYYQAGGTVQNGEEQHNEQLIKEALQTYSGDKSGVTVASKVGHFRYLDHNDNPKWGQQGCARYILETGPRSRDALGVDAIDLYYYHRPDRNVAYEESIGAMEKLVEQSVVKYVGISNASVEQIKYTQSVLGNKFVAVQNQFSPAFTSTLDTLKYTAEVGLAFLPWSPLGGFRSSKMFDKDKPFEQMGIKLGVSKQQVILAWELAQGEHVIPIPGFRRIATLEDSLATLKLTLSDDDINYLNKATL